MNEFWRAGAASEDSLELLEQRFWSMREASRNDPPPTAAERKALLRALRDAVGTRAPEFCEAIASDFGGRSHDETRMAEVVPALTLIRNALSNLDRWMRPEGRDISILF